MYQHILKKSNMYDGITCKKFKSTNRLVHAHIQVVYMYTIIFTRLKLSSIYMSEVLMLKFQCTFPFPVQKEAAMIYKHTSKSPKGTS